MRTLRRTLVAAAAVTAVAAAVWAPIALADDASGYEKSSGRAAIGLADGTKLVTFTTDDPSGASEIGRISGLEGDASLVGIDFRVQDGKLYGVGDEGGIYTLDTGNAEADKVEQLSVDLDGEFFGVDVNPAANALRVISDTDQNLRQPFNAAGTVLSVLPDTVSDTRLTNPATPPATGTVPARGVTGAAYTNNDLDSATATTLFDLDTTLDRISLQSPANAGTLAPTGGLGIEVGPDAGFDIVSTLEDGVTVANEAFATVESDDGARLVSIDLLTGTASDRGAFRADVTDLALELDE